MIDKSLLLKLIFAFILFTILGTLSHEFGHYIVAELYGVDAEIHYGYTSFSSDSYSILSKLSERQRIFITLGGPLQTLLTGSIGLFLLFKYKKEILSLKKLSFKYWSFIFMSLFWLRQVANFVIGLLFYLLTKKITTRSDEVRLSNFFQLPTYFIGLITAIIGLSVALLVIFKFIPKSQRFTFILGSFIGGISGYLIWLESLGEIILP